MYINIILASAKTANILTEVIKSQSYEADELALESKIKQFADECVTEGYMPSSIELFANVERLETAQSINYLMLTEGFRLVWWISERPEIEKLDGVSKLIYVKGDNKGGLISSDEEVPSSILYKALQQTLYLFGKDPDLKETHDPIAASIAELELCEKYGTDRSMAMARLSVAFQLLNIQIFYFL